MRYKSQENEKNINVNGAYIGRLQNYNYGLPAVKRLSMSEGHSVNQDYPSWLLPDLATL